LQNLVRKNNYITHGMPQIREMPGGMPRLQPRAGAQSKCKAYAKRFRLINSSERCASG
jgi:hypothetical protein